MAVIRTGSRAAPIPTPIIDPWYRPVAEPIRSSVAPAEAASVSVVGAGRPATARLALMSTVSPGVTT
jgi:hypothetical protein